MRRQLESAPARRDRCDPMERRCHRCGHYIGTIERVGRRDACQNCHSDLHCCLNCAFHDPTYHNQCREPQVEHQVDKQVANFCDYFSFRVGPRGAKPTATDDARSRLDALFRRNQ